MHSQAQVSVNYEVAALDLNQCTETHRECELWSDSSGFDKRRTAVNSISLGQLLSILVPYHYSLSTTPSTADAHTSASKSESISFRLYILVK
ncbi:hypothetical protein RRG08_061917 [Elysia crispata]|uniref:Uncharacterized protein n=1 Tax=Elysia crispata TaxID=231223 RepID=A0AAE1AVR8_9GAST|nr:hypothetical protein RRG08_061917 [Elysia crispata]